MVKIVTLFIVLELLIGKWKKDAINKMIVLTSMEKNVLLNDIINDDTNFSCKSLYRGKAWCFALLTKVSLDM